MKLEERTSIFYKFKTKYLLVSYLFGFVAYLSLRKIGSLDLWWHLRTGQYIVSQKVFPYRNIFSHSAPSHFWIAYSWLTEIIFYYVSIIGFNWLLILKTCLMLSTFVIVFKTTYESSYKNFNLSIVITLLMAFVSSSSWVMRPQLFSFLFTAFFVYILHKFESNGEKKILWFIPLIMLFWVNLHVYFVIGFFLVLVHLLGSAFRSWFLSGENKEEEIKKRKVLFKIIAVSLFVCLINPYTYRIFWEVIRLFGQHWARENITELQSPNFHSIIPMFFEIMLFLLIFSLSVAKKRPSFVELVLFSAFTYQAFYSLRDLPFWAIVMAPMLGRYLGEFLIYFKKSKNLVQNKIQIDVSENFIDKFLKKTYPFINGFLLVLLIGVIGCSFLKNKKFESCVDIKYFPLGAVEFIKENNLPGRMFNSFNWGGYLIYSLYPEWKVSIDGRTQAYGDKFLTDYSAIWELSMGWEKRFKEHKINFILWPAKTPLTEIFLLINDWKLIYFDEVAVIFIKDIPQNRGIIRKYNEKVRIKMEKAGIEEKNKNADR